jgi:hypothetical protein
VEVSVLGVSEPCPVSNYAISYFSVICIWKTASDEMKQSGEGRVCFDVLLCVAKFWREILAEGFSRLGYLKTRYICLWFSPQSLYHRFRGAGVSPWVFSKKDDDCSSEGGKISLQTAPCLPLAVSSTSGCLILFLIYPNWLLKPQLIFNQRVLSAGCLVSEEQAPGARNPSKIKRAQ